MKRILRIAIRRARNKTSENADHWLRRGKIGAMVFISAMASIYIVTRIPHALEFRKTRETLRHLAQEAAVHDLTYDAIIKNPEPPIGKLIDWFVTHPGNQWLYEGTPGREILWESDPPPIPETGTSGRPRGGRVIARVAGLKSNGIVLSYLGEL